MGFAGLDYYDEIQYLEYHDPFEILGTNGKYWITDTKTSRGNFSVNAGGYFPVHVSSNYSYYGSVFLHGSGLIEIGIMATGLSSHFKY